VTKRGANNKKGKQPVRKGEGGRTEKEGKWRWRVCRRTHQSKKVGQDFNYAIRELVALMVRGTRKNNERKEQEDLTTGQGGGRDGSPANQRKSRPRVLLMG